MRLVVLHPSALAVMLLCIPTAMFLEEQGTAKMDAGTRTARGVLRLPKCGLPNLRAAQDGLRRKAERRGQGVVSMSPAARSSSSPGLPRLVNLKPSDQGDKGDVPVNRERPFRIGAQLAGWSWDAHWCLADDDSLEKDASAVRAEMHEAMEYIYDFVPLKLCGHACALNVPWKITCCRCDGVLPAHELVRRRREDTRRATQVNSSSCTACEDGGEDQRGVGSRLEQSVHARAHAASCGASGELHRLLAPFLPFIPPQRRIYNFVQDNAAGEEEQTGRDDVGDEPAACQAARCELVRGQAQRTTRTDFQDFCWACRVAHELPPIFVALQALVSPSQDQTGGQDQTRRLRPPALLCSEGRRAAEREAEEDEEEDEEEEGKGDGTPSGGRACWSSHAYAELPGLCDTLCERAMAIGGHVMGPWWLLRVLEPDTAEALPRRVRACAGRDTVWLDICRAEGLVTPDLRPRVPFDAAVLDRGRDVGVGLDGVALDAGLLFNDLHSLPVWLHVYLESKKAQASMRQVVGKPQ